MSTNVICAKRSRRKSDPNRLKATIPHITWHESMLTSCVDKAEQALLNAGVHIYQRGNMLMRPIRSAAVSVQRINQPYGALTLAPVESAWLIEQMGKAAKWVRLKGENDFVTIGTPKLVVDTYLSRTGHWNAPVLTGIIEAPTLRPDGSILEIPGYDVKTGLLYQPAIDFPPIPDKPSKKDAEQALAVLRDLIKDFPFAEAHDESIALSALLTALIRRCLRSAPMHAFRAPKMASGKSLLVDVIGLVVNGRVVAVITLAADANEERKRIFSVLLAGEPIVSVDNVEHTWSSDVMCSVLTQESFQDRVLGHSKTITVPTSAFWLCTGNNLTFKGDLTTRVLPCDLDPKTERPEQRSFTRNLYQYIPEHRGELVQAALTILRAHYLAGRPDMGLKPYGRFEDWSNSVRASLVWLGMPDPCLSIADLEEADPIRQRLRNLTQSWYAVFGNKPATVAEAVERSSRRSTEEESLLYEVLEEAAGERGSINKRLLGHFLAKYALRIEGGFRLEQVGTRQHAALWRVVPHLNSHQQVIDLSCKNTNQVSSVSTLPPSI